MKHQKVVDEYGVIFTDVQHKDGGYFGYDEDGEYLEIHADFKEVKEV